MKITVVIGIKRGQWNYAEMSQQATLLNRVMYAYLIRGLSAGLLSRDRVPEKLSSVYSLVIAHPILEQWSWSWSNWLLMVWPRVETRHRLILRLYAPFSRLCRGPRGGSHRDPLWQWPGRQEDLRTRGSGGALRWCLPMPTVALNPRRRRSGRCRWHARIACR